MSLRVLCVGDMHLGRRPSRIPASLAEYGVVPGKLTPVVAWRTTVESALQQEVDVVLLAGDVVESLEDRFEAFGPLEAGVQRLVEAGIHVVGVTGNHDVEALPRLARHLSGFKLLGAGGEWEWVDLDCGEETLRVVGWSFPSRHHSRNPLDEFPVLPEDDVPTVGLLHCDLDAVTSQYAPVRRSDLERTSCAAWFLGHIHVPSNWEGNRPIGYLGSIAGLDPGEHGARGPWIFEVRPEGRVAVQEQLSASPVRWERVDLSCEHLDRDDEHALEEQLVSSIHSELELLNERLRPELGGVRTLGVRLRLHGRVPAHGALKNLIASSRLQQWVRSLDSVVYFIEKLVDETQPQVDLHALARFEDPPGLLARKLLVLEAGGVEAEALCRSMQEGLDTVADNALLWGGLEESSTDVTERALRCGWQILEELLAQREASPAR